MHPKGLVMYFQKMVIVHYIWLTVLEIIEFEPEEFLIF